MLADIGDVLVCGLVCVLVYMFLASLFEHKKVKFIHETGFAIIIGFIVGLFFYFLFNQYFLRLVHCHITQVNFNDNIVFYILLPPMLFADGYNLKKRRFFQNMYYINVFGLLGTILNFLVFAGLIYAVSALGLIRDFSNFNNIRYLQTWQILLYSSCMCSIDPIGSLTQIKPQYQPKLFSIIFGESLIKDAVTIVLYKSVERAVLQNGQTDFDWYTPFVILLTFVIMIVVSVLVGFAYAILLTLVFKHARFILKDNGITEVGMIFLTGYIAYLTSELTGFSGVITMLFCGITLSHFNNYNMSENGVKAAKVTFGTIALIAEGFLFLVLGIVSWQVEADSQQGLVITESITFIALSFVILFIARFFNIVVVTWMCRPCKGKDKWRVNTYELQIIYAAGLVKGAIPFALITSTSVSTQQSVQVTTLMIKCTVIILVFVTSLFFNGVLPVFIRNRRAKMKEAIKKDHPSLFDSLIENQRKKMLLDEQVQTKESKKYKSKGQKYWRKFDQGILKPFLIYNYANRREEIKMEKKKQRAEELKVHFESEPEQVHEVVRKPTQALDPVNEDKNVFIQTRKDVASSEEDEVEAREAEERNTLKKKQMQRRQERIKSQQQSHSPISNGGSLQQRQPANSTIQLHGLLNEMVDVKAYGSEHADSYSRRSQAANSS